MTGPDLATRQAVINRARGRCERCGHPGVHIHHRKPRGMGGTSDPAINTAPNLVFLCLTCHEYVERNRTHAYDAGWLAHRWEDPADVAAIDVRGYELVFLPDWTVERGFLPHYATPPF